MIIDDVGDDADFVFLAGTAGDNGELLLLSSIAICRLTPCRLLSLELSGTIREPSSPLRRLVSARFVPYESPLLRLVLAAVETTEAETGLLIFCLGAIFGCVLSLGAVEHE